jgi:hypothetical protein
MADEAESRKPWETKFLAALAQLKNVKAAARAAEVPSTSTYSYKGRNARFAAEWEAALNRQASPEPGEQEAQASRRWRASFFDALAETSNVTAAAARANVPLPTIYKLRREDRYFAAKWLAALAEGYDNLEMELVGYLRDPEPGRKMDVAAALRLLAAHRETVERRRALTAEEDEKATLESLDAFFEGLRQRRIANEAVLREADHDDGCE